MRRKSRLLTACLYCWVYGLLDFLNGKAVTLLAFHRDVHHGRLGAYLSKRNVASGIAGLYRVRKSLSGL